MLVALYSTRLVLNALGAEDYGIFSLVGGVIAMLSFLNSAMSVSTQRYLSFYMGANEKLKLRSVFNSSVWLHLIIGISIVIILEVAGIFLFDGVLNIPEERIGTAKIVYHFMVISTFFTINSVPFDGAINAHENMLFDGIAGILESFIKLGIAIWLVYVSIDKLVFYGLMIAGLTIMMRLIKGIYCYRNYQECRLSMTGRLNFSLMREMISFAGWNLFGSFCAIVRYEGLALVLNLFFGILVNAAYAIANQVNAQLSSFSVNMLRALTPQIVKSEGSGDRERMLRLSMLACKVSMLMLAFFAIPLIIEMPMVLKIWLKNIPEYSIVFCQLILLLSTLQQLTIGMMSAIQSVGRIRIYQTIVGSLLILNLPVAYIIIKLGYKPYTVLVGSIILEVFAGGARIYFAYKIAGLKVKLFIENILMKSVITVVIAFLISLVPKLLLGESLWRVLITGILSSFSLILLGNYIAFEKKEMIKIKEIANAIFTNIFKSLKIMKQYAM